MRTLALPTRSSSEFWDVLYRECGTSLGFEDIVAVSRQKIWCMYSSINVLAVISFLRPFIVRLAVSISSPADLCRRRGLHVLHQVLAWADRPGNKDSPSRAQVDGENILSSQGPCRRSELPPSDATRTEWKFSG